MKTILTLKYGNKYPANAVNSIYEKTNGKYNYVCVTDNPAGLNKNIKIINMDWEPEGHWEKIKLLRYNDLGSVLYMDLDTIIQKNMDHMWNYLDKHPVICYTYWKHKDFPFLKSKDWSYNYLSNYNSSVMLWKDASHIYNYWRENADYYMVKYAGDDRFLFHEDFTFDLFPEQEIYSFKFSGGEYKENYTIALLNGQEDFPNLADEYNRSMLWKQEQ